MGRQPGIYETWDEVVKQVNGFSDARHKGGFPTEDAADAWIQEERKKIMETRAELEVLLRNERRLKMTQVSTD